METKIYTRRKLFFFCVDVRFLLLFDRQWSNLISDCHVLPISIPLIVSSKRGGCHAMFGVTYHIWLFALFLMYVKFVHDHNIGY